MSIDLLSHKIGYIIRDQKDSYYKDKAFKGDEIYSSIEDAKDHLIKELERKHNEILSRSSYNNLDSFHYNKPVFILKVELPNCWMYDTKPIEDGSRYALRIYSDAKPALKYEYGEFKRAE